MRSVPAWAWALAVFSALLQVFCFPVAGPISLWAESLCWIALLPLLVALLFKDSAGRPLSLGAGAALGYLCGVGWYLGSCSWIYQTMYLYGGMEKPVAFAILILFSLYLALYHALFGLLFTACGRSRLGSRGALLLTPFAWVAVELARARVTGFPWNLLGNSQVDNSLLTRLAPLGGVMAMSFVIAAVNAAVATLWVGGRPRSRAIPAAGLALALALQLGGAFPLHRAPQRLSTPPVAVMVQENIAVGAAARGVTPLTVDQEMRQFTQLSLNPQLRMTKGSTQEFFPVDARDLHPAIIIWPEAPSHLHSNDVAVRSGVASLARAADAPVVVGTLGVDFSPSSPRGYFLYDSASLFDRAGNDRGRYDKIHLVPWGEYVPYKQFFAFAGKLTEGAGDMDPGHTRTVFRTGGHAYGVFVCYESIFGDEIRQFVANGAQVLVNISDDGWYGDTGAPWQHLNMARMRAIETHRWLLRSTNTGETTAIDPRGNYTRTPRHVRTAYALPFAYESDLTLYTLHGDWFAYLCAAVTTLALGFSFLTRMN